MGRKVIPKHLKRVNFSISMDQNILERIDRQRKDLSRSRIIETIMLNWLNSGQSKINDKHLHYQCQDCEREFTSLKKNIDYCSECKNFNVICLGLFKGDEE